MRSSEKVSNHGRIISASCRQRRKFFMLYTMAKSFNCQLQLLIKLRVKEVYLFHVFLNTTINCWNFNGLYASLMVFNDNATAQNYSNILVHGVIQRLSQHNLNILHYRHI
jgi:hypothetical protein